MFWLALACVALVYSGAHFLSSGVRFPLAVPNLGQVEEEARPLRLHLQNGGPITTNNPRQYGPTFLLALNPLLRWAGSDAVRLSNGLYAVAITLFAASFALTVATLWPLVPPGRRTLALVLLAVLWLNFAPAYAILAVKNVEIWELFLLLMALYCLLRGQRAVAGAAIGLAALTKLLPFAVFYYLLLRDRRTLLYACAAALALMLISHALYGPAVGLLYLPRVALSAMGNSWGLMWHENISIKGMLIKVFGHLEGTLNPAYAGLAHGGSGHAIVISSERLEIALGIGLALQVVGGLWLTWVILRKPTRTLAARSASADARLVFEWSLMSVMLLILSPQTAFEYCTLALGAFSYVLVRLVAAGPAGRPLAWVSFAGAVFLIANIVPRSLVARLLFIEQINRLNQFGQLSPTEGFQYYGFPLVGLLLLVVSLCSVSALPSDASPLDA